MTIEQLYERKDILLRAAFDMLRRAEEGGVVESPLEILTHYDKADCDGYCLMQDIGITLGLEENTKPIPLDEEE